MSRVLLLDGHSTQSLAAIRSLGRRGLDVTVASHWPWNPGRCSRQADEFRQSPDPAAESGRFLAWLEAELRAGEYDVLLPMNEGTVELVVGARERFERYAALPFPDTETMAVGLDKGRTVEAAREFGIPHPKTMLPGEVDLDAVGDELGYPVVVKPHRGSGRDGVCVCGSRPALEAAYAETAAEYGPTQLQEFVPNGGERGIYAIYDDSSTLAGVTVQRRIRSKPPEGGASTVRETIEDADLVALADGLLSGLAWEGVAMAEFRVDPRDDQPKLLEVNPRLWGSLPLSIAAGVDFPWLLYRQAIGERVPIDRTYDAGVRGRCLFTDLLQVRDREDTLRAVGEFLRPSPKPTTYDVLSASDPLPVAGQLILMGDALRRTVGSDGDSNRSALEEDEEENDEEETIAAPQPN